jgi:hypothetical protein
MKSSLKPVIVAAASIACASLSYPVCAKKMVYSPQVEKGEAEFEYYADWREAPGGRNLITHELEVEYGVTSTDLVALSLVYIDPPANGFAFDQYKLEWIHELEFSNTDRLAAAIYIEYQVKNKKSEADEFEFKPLLAWRLPGRPVTLALNGILEKEIGPDAGAGFELGYAASVKRRTSKMLAVAVEAFGEFGEAANIKPAEEQSHLAGPVLELELGHEIEWQIGALLGLTHASEDLLLKSNLAIEW